MRRSCWRNAAVLIGCAAVGLSPSRAVAEGQGVVPLASFSITPYVGVGFQSEYYDHVVRFSNGDTELLAIDPGNSAVFGVDVGYHFDTPWTVYANLATSSPEAEYVENGELRADIGLTTSQFEVGMLYDISSFPVAGRIAPFLIGGGASLTRHSLERFTWNDTFVEPNATSVGVHALAALDIPLAPKLSLLSQIKWTLSALSLGDLEEKIAAAQGGGLTADLESQTSNYFVFSLGLALRP
jgi:hypothetical protein